MRVRPYFARARWLRAGPICLPGGKFRPETRAEDLEIVDKRMALWRENCAKGNEDVFRKRLAWDGLDADRARGLAGRVRRADSELPPWAQLLGQMIQASQESGREITSDLASMRGERPVAFEELLHPFLRLARENLRRESGTAYSLLADAAHRQWERSLLLSWQAIAGETLDLEFTRFRKERMSPEPAPTNENNSPSDSGVAARPVPGR